MAAIFDAISSYGENKISTAAIIDFSRWYDNEWGYSNRCVDLAIFIGNKLKELGKQATQKAAAKA